LHIYAQQHVLLKTLLADSPSVLSSLGLWIKNLKINFAHLSNFLFCEVFNVLHQTPEREKLLSTKPNNLSLISIEISTEKLKNESKSNEKSVYCQKLFK
jgi:hypothetical protein